MKTDLKSTLSRCQKLKPDLLVISDLKWKYLVRSTLRGKNILILGETGCGKTLAVTSVANAVGKLEKFEKFNLGSTQDPRSSLIGNTHFDKQTGTIFNESTFVRTIRNPESIILLDEISRAHPDAWNILMSTLDDTQRYLRLDEKIDNEVVKVETGVTFIATANVGNEYTATRVMDRALLDRFPVKIEMSRLGKQEEYDLMVRRFKLTEKDMLKTLSDIVEIAEHVHQNKNSTDSKLTNSISTRGVVEMTELIQDGFSLKEIAECVIYPFFDDSGGVDSERTYVKQLVQKYVPIDGISATPFTASPKPNSNAPF